MQYIWFGSIGLIVGGALCFLPFPNAPEWARIVIFMAGYVIWDAFYTIANVPYGSLLGLISKDPGDRSALSAWRSIGGMIGNILPMVLIPFLCYNADQTINGPMVFVCALVMGALGFLFFQFMIKNTEVRVDEEVKLDDQPKFNVFKAMGNFLKNRPAVGATIAAMGMFIGMQGASTAVAVTFQIYFDNAQISGLVSMFSMIPIVVFTPLARKMVTKYGKKELSKLGALCYIVGAAVLLLAPLGIIPVTETSTGIDLVIYIIAQLIMALGMGIYSTVSWAMMGDAIDYNEWKTGEREEGVVYSLHSFFRKLAQGIGPAIALAIMRGFGYVNNANPVLDENGKQLVDELGNLVYTNALNAAGEYTVINVNWLSWEFALDTRLLVAILYLVSGVMLFVGLGLIYNLDKKTLEKMNNELAERRAQNAQPTEAPVEA